MARARDPNRDVAKQMYLDSNGEMLLKDIASAVGKSDTQIRKWKNHDKWDDELNGNVTNETKGNVTNEVTDTKERQSAVSSQPNERKRGGNPNPPNQFPKRNSFAEKHGFYSKVIPKELQDLFNELEGGISTENMLWDQIKVQYMAIMRAQSIMFVKSKEELVKEIKKERFELMEDGPERIEVEYEIQFAWERQAQFLNAQSRAISELRSLIEQFETAADKTDKRRLELTQMQLTTDKTKAEIERLQKMNEDGNQETTEEKLAEYFNHLQEAFTNEPTGEE